ncbi:MAG: arginase, partial [Rhodoferax sp.]|nr:arginase [Rhodoferax sp.]
MPPRVLHLIGAEVGEGASDGGCKWGAAALREHGIAQALAATGRTVTWGDNITAQPRLAT